MSILNFNDAVENETTKVVKRQSDLMGKSLVLYGTKEITKIFSGLSSMPIFEK